MGPFFRNSLIAIAALVGYFLLTRFGFEMSSITSGVSPVWPATGFGIGMLLVFGPRFLPAIALGALAINFLHRDHWGVGSLITIANVGEAYLGYWLITGIKKRAIRWGHYADALAFGFGAALAGLFSATIGVFALVGFGDVPSAAAGSILWTWWIGDFLGALVVAPVLCHVHSLGFGASIDQWKQRGIALVLLFVTAGVLYLTFAFSWGGGLLFLVFPCLLAVILLNGAGWAQIFALLISFICILCTIAGLGPFAAGSTNEKLVNMQLFLAAVAVTTLVLSGMGRERLSKVAVMVLLFCWTVSGAVFFSFENSETRLNQTHFDAEIENTMSKMTLTMKSYEAALRGGASLYAASADVNGTEWRVYNETLQITKNYPGVKGLGVLWPVPFRQRDRFETEMRKAGRPEFEIKPIRGFHLPLATEPRDLFVTKFIEPYEANAAALGIEMGGEPHRRTAAELSRDSGEPVITSKITLVQDAGRTPGFLLFYPMYRNGVVPGTVEQRRAEHIGWVYGAFVYSNFFAEVFGQTNGAVELYAVDGDQLLFNSFTAKSNLEWASPVTSETSIRVGQRELKLQWRQSAQFVNARDTTVAWVGFFGAIASLLLTSLMVNSQLLGQRSKELAAELTRELTMSREKFREGERRLLFALDGSNDGIWDWNMLKSEMYVSGKISENYGWPQTFHLVTAENLRPYAHPDDLAKIEESIVRHLKGQSPAHEVETRYRGIDGEWKWVLTRGKISERDEAGRAIRMTGVHIDIDALKRAQNQLLAAKNQIRKIASHVPSLISEFNEDLVCTFANPAFARWFGIDPDQIEGVPMRSLLSSQNFEERMPIFQKILAGEALHYDREVVREFDGQKRHVIASYLPNIVDGQPRGFYLFLQDITELKRAETVAIEAQKAAENARDVKTQFLANMSHEIRTPMNGVIGMTALLRRTELDEKQRKFADAISRSSENLLGIINDILDFSKAEAGKLLIENIEFSLPEMLDDLYQTFQFGLGDKKIGLEIETDLKSTTHYIGDVLRIRQVLTNLVGNAIKFTARGRVQITVRATKCKGGRDVLRFQVTDTGIGIAKEERDRLFQPFAQADSTTSRRFGGTGLGLSISKQLVELMQGRIGVDSERGQGSTFWFELRLERVIEGVSEKTPSLEVAVTRGARILVAEDNPINQEIALETLRHLGYEPMAANNGVEALNAIHTHEFDLILMDCQMPEMDGYEATAKIRRLTDEKLRQVPIVAMTAHVTEADRRRCFDAGMNDFLTKPAKEGDLIRTIERALAAKKNPVAAAKGHILVVTGDSALGDLWENRLRQLAFTSEMLSSMSEAALELNRQTFDVVVVGLDSSITSDSLRGLAQARGRALPIVGIEPFGTDRGVDELFAAGLSEVLPADFDDEDLSRALQKWMNFATLIEEKTQRELQTVADVFEGDELSPLIDNKVIDKIRRLQQPGQSDVLQKFKLLFFENADSSLTALDVAFAASDYGQIREITHALKSAAANLGALRVADLSRQLESIAGSDNPGPRHQFMVALFERLKSQYAETQSALSQYSSAA